MLKKILASLLCLLLAGTLAACGGGKGSTSSQEGYPVTIGGTSVTQQPQTVVSLSPSLTEIFYDLGLDSRLSGVSSFCDTPSGAKDKRDCGTAQTLALDIIKELKPGAVVTFTPLLEADLVALQQENIDVVVFSRAQTFDELWGLYTDVAKLMEGNDKGETLAREAYAPYKEKLEDMTQKIAASLEGEAPQKALYLKMLDTTVATGDTLEGKILEALGLENLAAEGTGWDMGDQKAKLQPEVLFYDQAIDEKALGENALYSAAVKAKKAYPLDGTALERQSFRLLDTVFGMADLLYPDLGPFGSPQTSASSSSQR